MSSNLRLSIVVPTRNSSATLGPVLTAIQQSDLPRHAFELIIVDDASSDGSASAAARFADIVVRLKGPPSGPAYARNRGAELARGEFLAFLDPDVLVKPDTFGRMLQTLADQPEEAAISASHAILVSAPNFVSQYWNLLLRYSERGKVAASASLASECCVVRRNLFLSAGMYDEWRFETANLEGLELGQRLRGAGHRLLFARELEVTYLKRWTIRSVLHETWMRSELLTRSLGYRRTKSVAPGEVVFALNGGLGPAIGLMGTLTLAAAFVPQSFLPGEAALALVMILLTNLRLQRFSAASRGPMFALAAAPLHVLVEVVSAFALVTGWLLRNLVGDRVPDARTQAFSEVGLELWPPIPRRR